MRIYYLNSQANIPDHFLAKLEKIGTVTQIKANKIGPAKALKQVKDAEILIAAPSGVSHIDKSMLEGIKDLKYITTVTIGFDWIDVKTARELGIPVSNCEGANTGSVAEHIIGLTIDLSKRITEFDRDVRTKNAYSFFDYKGHEIKGKTFGTIGLGDIGSEAAKLAHGIGMRAIGYNRSPKDIENVEYLPLEQVLGESDVISINLALNNHTEGFIGEKEILKMKDGVILINTAREELWDKDAVIRALENGKFFGLGVETAILKPIPENDPYLHFDNVIVNPHNAFNTFESSVRVQEAWVDNVLSFAKGEVKRVVN